MATLSSSPDNRQENRPVLALSGGIGGAKLALGLAHVLPDGALTVVANTGDDFEHLGLSVSPDIDTLTYVLGDLDNQQTGWGRRDETWSFMETLGALGGETWFKLGDRDLALHVERSQRLRAGETLSAITADLARRLGARGRILPMSDDPVRTQVLTADGPLDFQRYFVGMQCAPAVTGFRFAGAENAAPHPDFLGVLRDTRLRAVIICPSNPFISIDPILAVPGVRAALTACAAPIIAISPIIGGEAVKGPTAKMMRELGIAVTAASVADHYAGLIDGFIVDRGDAAMTSRAPVAIDARTVLMRSLDDKIALATATLAFADRLAREPSARRKGHMMGAA